MQDLISSFLIQTKECSLPGIGTFRTVNSPVQVDVANKEILPATEEIIFNKKTDHASEGLIKYISYQKNITEKEAEEQLDSWCKTAREKLHEGQKIELEPIGSLHGSAAGSVHFQPQKAFCFFEPVAAERVIHKNAEHAVLVGDRETTSSVMNQFLREEESVKRPAWKIIAIALLAVAVIVLFIYFYTHSFSQSATGNQMKHSPEKPVATYSVY